MSVNKVIVSGNLTSDPQSKAISNGIVTNFSIAVNSKYKNKNGQTVESVDYVDIQAFGKLAQVIQAHLKKGRKVLIQGKLKQDKWTGTDGKAKSKLVIKAEQLQFLDSPKTPAFIQQTPPVRSRVVQSDMQNTGEQLI